MLESIKADECEVWARLTLLFRATGPGADSEKLVGEAFGGPLGDIAAMVFFKSLAQGMSGEELSAVVHERVMELHQDVAIDDERG